MTDNLTNIHNNTEKYKSDFRHDELRYSKRNFWKGNAYIEGNYFVKDYSKNPFFSKIYGMICIYQETSALKKLQGLKGIPSLHSKPSAFCYKMEFVPGTPLKDLQQGDISEKFFERLVSLFESMHSRGVVHLDAHRRNILIHDDWPYLIDFSTAYIKGRIPFLDPGLFNLLTLLDKERLYKIEKLFFNRGTPPDMFYIYKKIKKIKEKK